MSWGLDRCALRAAAFPLTRLGSVLAAALTLAGCNTDGQMGLSAAQPRGATVAFESIDGPPPGQFQTLVKNLNDEAQSRQLAVMSRESPSAYRVRGYLTAKVVKDQTTITWLWDVFDRDENRALRISGEEQTKGRKHDAWSVADDAMLRRIAKTSVEQLATFLTSPDIALATPVPPGESQVALIGSRDPSPEAAGIFRIFHANADPVATEPTETVVTTSEAATPVPLPRRRPTPEAAVSALDTLKLAASKP